MANKHENDQTQKQNKYNSVQQYGLTLWKGCQSFLKIYYNGILKNLTI